MRTLHRTLMPLSGHGRVPHPFVTLPPMAGGMSRRGEHGPMSGRVRRGRERQPAEALTIRHCWVTDSQGQLPALLLEWRHNEGGWHGRVVRPIREDEGWAVVEEWLPAGLLERA